VEVEAVSRILKMAAAVIGVALVVAGAVVVYRETDLLTGSLVLLSGLMIAALLARRAAAREERAGMADWEQETLDSEQAAGDLFAEWGASTPSEQYDRSTPSAPVLGSAPSVAPPIAPRSSGPATPVPSGAEVPQPADPSVAVSRPLRSSEPQDTESLVASLFLTDDPAPSAGIAPTAPEVDEPPAIDIDDYISAPSLTNRPEPAFAGAGAPVGHASPIDWTGQGGRVDERVKSSDDILRASEATALPSIGAVGGGDGGSELARLLAKVEARLRDYD
jgi:hypothetical protein